MLLGRAAFHDVLNCAMCAAAMTDAPDRRGDERFHARFVSNAPHTPSLAFLPELPILVIRSQFAGDCAHVAVTRGQEQKPASGDSSIEGPRSGKDSRQSPFHSDASAWSKESENQA